MLLTEQKHVAHSKPKDAPNYALSESELTNLQDQVFKEGKDKGLKFQDTVKLFQERHLEILSKREKEQLEIGQKELLELGSKLGNIQKSPVNENSSLPTCLPKNNLVTNTKVKSESELKLPPVASLSSTPVKKEISLNIIQSNSLKIALKSPTGFRGISANVSLDSMGNIEVIQKDFQNKTTDISKNFKALYLGEDNVLRDKQGNEIKTINTATGNINSSLVPTLINKQSSGSSKILEVKDSFLNHFTHDGQQVIFIKGNPIEILNQTDQDKVSKMAIPRPKNQETSLSSNSTSINKIPWVKHTYDEKINGIWHAKTAYLRMNNLDGNNILEIYKGRDKNGNEIWENAEKSSGTNFTIVKVDKSNGKLTNGEGAEISEFSKVDGTKLKSSVVNNLIETNIMGLRGVKENNINDLLINGKRPIFL